MFQSEATHPQPPVLDADETARQEYSRVMQPVLLKHGDVPPKRHEDYAEIVLPAWEKYQRAVKS